MENRKKILFTSVFVAASVMSTLVYALGNHSVKEVTGQTCTHDGEIQNYKGYAPSIGVKGEMKHYACCDCNSAFQDEELTVAMGNTITEREKIDINSKTTATEIERHTLSANNDLLTINESAPHVVGLDQTNWTIANGGISDGRYSFYNIDSRDALRVSSENIEYDHIAILNTTNNGYSSFRFDKGLSGYISVSFEYKMYNLDTSYRPGTGTNQAVFGNKNGLSDVVELDLITDNLWHTVTFQSKSKVNLDGLTIRLHHFKGEMYVANLVITSTGLSIPKFEQSGSGVTFTTVSNADYYIVHDNNNVPNEIRYEAAQATDGKIKYTPTAAGLHDIYVTAHSNNAELDYSTTKTIEDIEVDPNFFYDNFANEYYVEKSWVDTKNWIGKKTYDTTDINDAKGWGTHTTDKEFYHAYYTDGGAFSQNAEERMRYNTYQEGSNLYRIIQEAKDLGTNVIYVSHADGYYTGNSLDANPELKAIMDACYENNLKVVVMANEIYSLSASQFDKATIKNKVYDFLNNRGLSLVQHRAFYGFALLDEPPEAQIQYVAWTAKAVIDWFSENHNRNLAVEKPFFICALFQYYTTGGLFCCEHSYKAYVETWITTTGLNYYSTDIYTYTTQMYDTNDEIIDVNYKIYMDLKSKFQGLRTHLVATSNNDKYNRAACNVYDIYSSTLFAAAFNNYGISRYTYFPAIWTYHWNNGVVNRDGSHTSKYAWVKQSNAQFELIQDMLYGYEPISYSYSTNGGYSAKSANTRTIDVTLSNGEDEINMFVNYNTQASYTSTVTKYVPADKSYYLFGNGVATTKYTSAGQNVSLTNGQAVLIFEDESAKLLEVQNLNEIISYANSLDVSSNNNVTQFLSLTTGVDATYNTLSAKQKELVEGYEAFLSKKATVNKSASMIYDGSYFFYDSMISQDVTLGKTNDPQYGLVSTYSFSSATTTSIPLSLFGSGKDWSCYKKIGFLMSFDVENTEGCYFIANSSWDTAIYATKKAHNASANIYYYEFDMSVIQNAFTADSYIQVYFSNPTTHFAISGIVGFGGDLDKAIDLVEKANAIDTMTNMGKTAFTLMANAANKQLKYIAPENKLQIPGYNTFLNKQSSLEDVASILYDGAMTLNLNGSWPSLNEESSDLFGSVRYYNFGSNKTGTIDVFFNDAKGGNWTSHKKFGVFVEVSAVNSERTWFIAKDDWSITSASSGTRYVNDKYIYYYELEIPSTSGTFAGNPYVCVYLSGRSSYVRITDLVALDA